MGRFFKNRPRVGAPISLAGIARGLDKLDYALTNLRVENGRVIWSQLGAPTLLFGDDGRGSIPGVLTGALPDGGDEYQVLQRDSSGAAVWDWVRVSVPET